MGGSTHSKLERQLAVPAPTEPLPTRDEILNQPNVGDGNKLNVSLHDTERLLDDDTFWLDETELHEQEDEDAKLAKECHNTGVSLHTWIESQPTWKEASIPSHELIKKYLGAAKTTEYTIVTHAGTVKRRYRDFVALRNALEIRFPGSCIPPLPLPRSLGKTEPGFVQQRAYMLEQFLRCVLANPFWSRDDITQTFLESAKRFDRQECLRGRGQLIREGAISIASKRWSQALMDTVPIPNPIFVNKKATQELEKVKEYLVIMRDLHTVLRKHATGVNEGWKDFAHAFQLALKEESRLVVFAAGVDASPSDALFQIAQTYETHSQVASASLKEEESVLLVPILYEILYVDSYLERLRNALASIASLRKLTDAYKEQKQSKENASFTTRALMAVPVDDNGANAAAAAQRETAAKHKLAKMRLNAVYAQMKARRDICGVLLLELNRFTKERAIRLRVMLAAIGNLHLARAKSEEALWQKFVDAHAAAAAAAAAKPASSGMLIPPPPAPPQEQEITAPAANPFQEEEEAPAPPASNPFQPAPAKEETQDDEEAASEAGGEKRLLVQFTYVATQADEMDVEEGELLAGEIDPNNPQWYLAHNLKTGKSGLVPTTYVKEVTLDEDNGEDEHAPNAAAGKLDSTGTTTNKRSQRELDSNV